MEANNGKIWVLRFVSFIGTLEVFVLRLQKQHSHIINMPTISNQSQARAYASRVLISVLESPFVYFFATCKVCLAMVCTVGVYTLQK